MVNSVRTHKSVLDIVDPVDLAFIVVPARFALEAVKECAQKGVRGIVMITAGFSELGEEGRRMEQRPPRGRTVGRDADGRARTAWAS